MTLYQSWIIASLAVFLVGGHAVSVSAQLAPPNRPTSNGVFAGGGRGPSDRPRLGLSGSVYGAFDNDIIATLTDRSISAPGSSRSGLVSGGGMGLNFSRPGRIDFGAAARVGVSHYPGITTPTTASYATTTNASTALTDRTQLRLSGRFEYAPRYSLASSLIHPLDDTALAPIDDGLQGLEPVPTASYRQHFDVGISQEITRRGSVSARYRFSRTDFTNIQRDLDVHGGSITYRHELAENLSARFGYGY